MSSLLEKAEEDGGLGAAGEHDNGENEEDKPLRWWSMVALCAGMSGTQLVWSVQNAYGNSYIYSLGVSPELTALVWLASPLAGLLVQPTIGPLSDETPGRFRRRSWLLASTILTYISLLYCAFAPDFPAAFGVPSSASEATTISIALVSLWLANFGLNAMQALVRDLLLDRAPSYQQPLANAWATRFADIAAVLGYLAGYLDLSSWTALGWIGGGEFRKLVVVQGAVSVVLVLVVCGTQPERRNVSRAEEGEGAGGKVKRLLRDIKESVADLPLSVRRVCYVQTLAWIGYSALLSYSTTYISSLVYLDNPSTASSISSDASTRPGSLPMVLWAATALVSAILFPLLCSIGASAGVLSRLSTTSRKGRFARRLLSKVTPRNLWTCGLALFAVSMAGTFLVRSVAAGQAVVAVTGVSWALGEWVPYALVLETVRELERPATSYRSPYPLVHSALSSASPVGTSLTHPSHASLTRTGGSLLGIHATTIILAKIVLSLSAAGVLKLYSVASSWAEYDKADNGGAVWILRVGGAAGAAAAVVSRWTVEPTSEGRYREGLLGRGGKGRARGSRGR